MTKRMADQARLDHVAHLLGGHLGERAAQAGRVLAAQSR